jgi:hypothetical protein
MSLIVKYRKSVFVVILRLAIVSALAILVLAIGAIFLLQGFLSYAIPDMVIGLALLVCSVFFVLRQTPEILGIEINGKISVTRLFSAGETLGPLKKMEVFKGTKLIIYYAGGTMVLDIHNFSNWRQMLKDLEQASGVKIENQ